MSQKIPTQDQSPNPVKIHPPKMIGMHANKPKIFPRAIRGFFQNIRHATMALALLVYAVLPWLTWDGRQAILFDLSHQQFFILGLTFTPQDFFFLSWLLIIAAFSLFVVTVFAGRVFCGYICPQTTWTAFYLWIEKITEGERNARMKLDKASMSLNKFVRRSVKHFLWLLVAFVTGFIFVGYFTPIKHLAEDFITGALGSWGYVFIILFTVFTYLNAGWMREQVCFHMCPYGRFQSVMFDKDTLIVSYDAERGESRGSRKKNTNHKEAGLGDCIDCQLCVQVCPTGIDIRDGLQLECIQCAACIDACDSIMDQMGYQRGLVRYTTEHMLKEKTAYHWLRPSLIFYSLAVIAMVSIFSYRLALRVPLAIDAMRDRTQLYRENSEGLIENVYTLRIINKSQQPHDYELNVIGNEHIKLMPIEKLSLAAGEIANIPVTLQADPTELSQSKTNIVFKVNAIGDINTAAQTESRFMAPK